MPEDTGVVPLASNGTAIRNRGARRRSKGGAA